MVKIRFSAGHGQGREHNRGGLLFNEGDENYNFTDLLLSKLKNYDVDAKEIRHERGNKDYALSERANYGNGADLFYSSHSNAASPNATGVEVILSYQSLKYYSFAEKLCKLISEILQINNRGVKFKAFSGEWQTKSNARESNTNWYGELRNNKAKCAIIIEHFFHTNKNDSEKYLKNKDLLATKIVELIANEFNIKKSGSQVVTQAIKSNQDKLYQVSVGAFANKTNADKLIKDLKDKGFSPYYTLIDNQNKKTEKPVLKSISEIAKEVINGKWGNGNDRINRLRKAGYDPVKVQAEVNRLI